MQHQNQSPANIRIENRKASLPGIWESPEWKAAKAKGIEENPECHFCHAPTQVPHHDDYEVYGKPEYLEMQGVLWLCNTCHGGRHQRRHQCPVCGKLTAKVEGEPCFSCISPEKKDAIRVGKQARNASRNRYNQRKYRALHPGKEIINGVWVSRKQEA